MQPLTLVDAEVEQCIKDAEQADRLDRRTATFVAILGFVGVVISGALLILGETIL